MNIPEEHIQQRLQYYHCTRDHPWSPGQSERTMHVIHLDAVPVGQSDSSSGCHCEILSCPHCGHTFEQELPQ